MASRGPAIRARYALRWLAERFAAGCQFLLPGGQVVVAGVLFQRGVSLPQRLVVSAPGRQEGWFHVEHAPVEKPAPAARAFLEKLVNLRVDDLRRELFGQVRNACSDGAAHMPFGPAPSRAHAEGYGARGPKRFPSQHEGILRRARSAPRVGGFGMIARDSGRMPLRAGWSCPRHSVRRRDWRRDRARARRQPDNGIARRGMSRVASGSYSRIGITTYRALVAPGARTRQLEFPSVTPISTSLPSTAASASSR